MLLLPRTIVGKHHKAKEEREESLDGIVGYQLMYVNELYKNDIIIIIVRSVCIQLPS